MMQYSHSEDMVPSINLFQAVSSAAFVAAVGYSDLNQIVSMYDNIDFDFSS